MELEVHLEEKLASINRGDVGPNLALPRWLVSKPRASQVARGGAEDRKWTMETADSKRRGNDRKRS